VCQFLRLLCNSAVIAVVPIFTVTVVVVSLLVGEALGGTGTVLIRVQVAAM